MNSLKSVANSVVESCSSTNDLAKKLAEEGWPDGTWISARVQEQGRGRMGRRWESSSGNLYLSLIVRFVPQLCWTWVPLTIACAVSRYLREKFPTIDVSIKWPNDLWIQGSKLAGILCEGSFRGEQSFIIAGLGLNCNQAPLSLDRATTSLFNALQTPVLTDEIRAPILSAILQELEYLKTGGPGRVQEFYSRWAVLSPGTAIQWGSLPHRGFVKGLGQQGELRVSHSKDGGPEISIFAEDVSVTFLTT